jgi:hypothetical protein
MALFALSCSGRVTSSGAGAAPDGAGGEISGSGGVSGSMTDGGSPIGSGGAPAVCAGQIVDAKPTPVDILLLFDQSSSMTGAVPGSNPTKSWWQEAQRAVANFVNDPRATGSQPGYLAMTVGVQFFPLNGVAPQSCLANYETPEVELGMLPDNASAISAAMQKHQPSGFEPTAAALTGAIAHMKSWASDHPNRYAAVVLVTDGFPTECDPKDIVDIAAIARNAFETEPKVHTFVVGLNFGPDGSNLHPIAQAGGTYEAVLIDGDDVGSRFVSAMLDLSYTPMPGCRFALPSAPTGQAIDLSTLSVTFTSFTTQVQTQLPRLGALADCDLNMNDGFFLDPPMNPEQIALCPGTCGKVPMGSLETTIGCMHTTGL